MKLALKAYENEDYEGALKLYWKAATLLGEKNFRANIILCEKHLNSFRLLNNSFGEHSQSTFNTLGEAASNSPASTAHEAKQSSEITTALLSPQPIQRQAKLTALYVLDPISELSWSKQFILTPLRKNDFVNQINSTSFDFLFLESCWKGNGGDWEYAFTSPGLKHENARKLLSAIDLCRKKGIPIVFWNKEDPMHFEKFLPIAKLSNVVLTTDSNLIGEYIKELRHNNVGVVGFGADPQICNPRDRFRSQPESVCFAGAYYPEHHDERVKQMNYVLPAVLEFKGAIYDRYSHLDTDRYRFPKQYFGHIRESVQFSEIVKIYKKFKVFLNVNTIIDSPTMMSRRVYELLASGTPVVSAPSAALFKQFAGVVKTAENEADVKNIVGELLTDQNLWERTSHIGYRTVLEKHTYSHKRREIEQFLSTAQCSVAPPLVSIIVATCRPKNVARTVENISRQSHPNCEVVYVVTPNFTEDDKKALGRVTNNNSNIKRVEILVFGTDATLGRCLNEAIKVSAGQYIAKFDDDNFYFDRFISDLLLPFEFNDYMVVGKESYYCYLGGKNHLIWRYPEKRHRESSFVAGDAMILKREVFEKTAFPEKRVGEDTKLLKDIVALGGKIYSADHFNFIKYRAADLNEHTWVVEEEQLLKQSIVVAEGLNEEIAKC